MLNLLKSTIYTRVSPDKLHVLHVESERRFEDEPLIAIEKEQGRDPKTLAIGGEARSYLARDLVYVVNPFLHCGRLTISDFVLAGIVLKHAFRNVFKTRLLTPAPKMIIHPLYSEDDQPTEIETRAFQELAVSVGSRDVAFHQGDELGGSKLDFGVVASASEPEIPERWLAAKRKGHIVGV